MYRYFLIIDAEFGDINRRNGITLLVVIRIKGDQSVDRPEIKFSVARLFLNCS